MKTKLNRGRENKLFISMMIVAVLAFGVFFTSKTWMYDDSAIAQTAFNESIGGLSQTTLILRDWEYNPKNELMEVTLERIHSGSDAVKPTFSFYAKEQNESHKYHAELVYQSDNNMIVQIEDVPESFQVIGLFVTEHRDRNILKQEYKKQLENKSEAATMRDTDIKESDLPEPEQVIIVGDYRKIESNKSLATKTDKGYKKENIIADMENTKQEITTIIEEDIPFHEDLVTTLKKEKASLKQNMRYEMKEEQEDTKRELEQKDKAINDAKNEIKKLKKKVKELKDNYQNREDKLNALMGNKPEDKQQKNGKTDANHTEKDEQASPKNKQDKNAGGTQNSDKKRSIHNKKPSDDEGKKKEKKAKKDGK